MRLLLSAILTLSTLQQQIEDKDVSLYKLRKLLGIVKKSEQNRAHKGNNKSNKDKNKSGKKQSKKRKKKFNVPIVVHKIQEHIKGQTCPQCSRGKLYKHESGSLLRITGNIPYTAEKHITKQLRCNACQQIYKAPLPEAVLEDGGPNQQYGYSSRTLMVINKFFTGTPYNHQSNLSDIFNLSISASTIFNQAEYVANDVIPVYYELIRQAANALNFMIDDTHNRILSQQPEERANRNGKGTRLRTGVYTSGLIALLSTNTEIILFETSLGHAGEHLDSILSKRSPGLLKPLIMSDALSNNNPTVIEVEQSNCNSHCRRQFYDLEEKHPEEVNWLLNKYANIWINEKAVKDKSLNPEDRLGYHKNKSLPVMEEIKEWGMSKLNSEEFEEHSSFSKAIKYLLKHYNKLVKFCKVPGALLDNNRMEETLKIVIRGRKTAYFYKTANGAGVANVLISIIATAYSANVKIFDYLLSVQKNRDKVKQDPKLWLPWNYTEQIRKLQVNNSLKKEAP